MPQHAREQGPGKSLVITEVRLAVTGGLHLEGAKSHDLVPRAALLAGLGVHLLFHHMVRHALLREHAQAHAREHRQV